MTLELKNPLAGTDEDENAELKDMTKRFWIGAALTLPVFALAMAHVIPGLLLRWSKAANTHSPPRLCWAQKPAASLSRPQRTSAR
jgi:Cu+-exporting ATPase